MNSLFESLPSALFEEEITTVFHQDKHIRIERILSCGQSSPDGFWYDQIEDEWIVLLQGTSALELETQVITLQAGDTLFLPKHQKHRIIQTSSQPICIWLCVFYQEEKPNETKEIRPH